MFSLLLAQAFMRRTEYVNFGHKKMHLSSDVDIELKIGYNNQAFVMGNNDFFKNSVIRIINGYQYQDVDPNSISSQKGVAIVGDKATIYFTANKPCDVEIWIMDKDNCPSHSLIIESSGAFNFEIDPKNLYHRFCVFPFTSEAREVYVGQERNTGVAYLIDEKERYSCHGYGCDFTMKSPFYAVIEDIDGPVRLTGSGKFPQSDVCKHSYFAYMNVSAIAYPKFKGAKTSLSCKVQKKYNNENAYREPEGYYRNNEYHQKSSSISSDSVFGFVIFIFVIAIIIFALSSVFCGNDACQNNGPTYGRRMYGAPTGVGEVLREADLLHREHNLRRREEDLRRREYNAMRGGYTRTGFSDNTYTVPPRYQEAPQSPPFSRQRVETVTEKQERDPQERVPPPPRFMSRAEPMKIVEVAPKRND